MPESVLVAADRWSQRQTWLSVSVMNTWINSSIGFRTALRAVLCKGRSTGGFLNAMGMQLTTRSRCS